MITVLMRGRIEKIKLSRCKVVNSLSTYSNVMQSRMNRKWFLPKAKAEFMSRGESRDCTSVNPSGLLMFSMLVGSMKYKCNQIFWHFHFHQ